MKILWGYEVSVETYFNQINGISKIKLVQSSYDKKNSGYTIRRNDCMKNLNCIFFPDRHFLSQWNGYFVRRNKYICKKQEKNEYEKIESGKHSTELSVYKIKQAGDN